MGTFSRRIGTAVVTVVATALVALAPLTAGAAEGRVAPSGKAARSNDALAEDLVERFLDLLVAEPDLEGLQEFLSPAFLRQGAAGTFATKLLF